jgi:hypothetical protein
MALALSPMPTLSMFREAPTPGLLSSLDDWPRPTTPPRCYWSRAIEPDRHPLILDGLAVTFYLVFKEPVLLVHPQSASQPPSGEPFKLTNPSTPCQAFITTGPKFFELARCHPSSCVANPTHGASTLGGRRVTSHGPRFFRTGAARSLAIPRT